MNIQIFAVSVFALMVLSSCNYNDSKNRVGQLSQLPDRKLQISFENIQTKIFSQRCNTCHGHYASYTSVVRDIGAIQNAVQSGRMPKTGSLLSQDDKGLLDAWIAAGFPEKESTPSPSTPEPTLAPTWASLSQEVIFPKCALCHNPQGEAKFLDLSSRLAIFQNRNRKFSDGSKLLDFDDVEKSYLIQTLKDDEEPMPPTSSKLPRLSNEELKNVVEWIRLGLP